MRGLGREEEDLEDTVSHLSIYLTGLDELYRCRVILVIARSDRCPDIQPWRVTATGFRHQDTYPLAVRKALRYLCRIFERHLAPTPMRFFPPAIRTPSLGSTHEKSGTVSL